MHGSYGQARWIPSGGGASFHGFALLCADSRQTRRFGRHTRPRPPLAGAMDERRNRHEASERSGRDAGSPLPTRPVRAAVGPTNGRRPSPPPPPPPPPVPPHLAPGACAAPRPGRSQRWSSCSRCCSRRSATASEAPSARSGSGRSSRPLAGFDGIQSSGGSTTSGTALASVVDRLAVRLAERVGHRAEGRSRRSSTST